MNHVNWEPKGNTWALKISYKHTVSTPIGYVISQEKRMVRAETISGTALGASCFALRSGSDPPR